MRRRGRVTPTRGVGFGTIGQPGRRRRVVSRSVVAGELPNPRRTVQWWQFEPPRNVTDSVTVAGGGPVITVTLKNAATDASRQLPTDTILPSTGLFPGGAGAELTGGGRPTTTTRKTAVWAVSAVGGGRVTVTQAPRVRPPQSVTVTGGGNAAVTARKTFAAVAVIPGGGSVAASHRKTAVAADGSDGRRDRVRARGTESVRHRRRHGRDRAPPRRDRRRRRRRLRAAADHRSGVAA